MEYKIRRAVPADEQRIRELFIEMLNAIYHTQDVKQGIWTNIGHKERILYMWLMIMRLSLIWQ